MTIEAPLLISELEDGLQPERPVQVDVEVGLRELLDDLERDRVRHARGYHSGASIVIG